MSVEVLSSTEQIAIRAKEIFSRLPETIRWWVTQDDVLMVLGGLKNATDLDFFYEQLPPEAFEEFKHAFEASGLRVSEVRTFTDGREDYLGNGLDFHNVFLYNPAALVAATTNSEFAPPYDGKQPLLEYVRESVQQGYHRAGVLGTIFAFPQSAIKDFMSMFPQDEHGNWLQPADGDPRWDNRPTIYSGNETYWHFPPRQSDVDAREEKKQQFFEKLNTNVTMQGMLHSRERYNSSLKWARQYGVAMGGAPPTQELFFDEFDEVEQLQPRAGLMHQLKHRLVQFFTASNV